MLDYICRLVIGFEREHAMRPNLLYINKTHCEHLKASFDESYSMGQIMDILQMEVIIDSNSVHPHVCWTQVAQQVAS